MNSFQHVHLFLCYHFPSYEIRRFHQHRSNLMGKFCPKMLIFFLKQKNQLYSAHVYRNSQRKGRRERKIVASPGVMVVRTLRGILGFLFNPLLHIPSPAGSVESALSFCLPVPQEGHCILFHRDRSQKHIKLLRKVDYHYGGVQNAV